MNSEIGCDEMDIYVVIAVLCIIDGILALVLAIRDNEKWGILVFLMCIIMLFVLLFSWLLENQLIILPKFDLAVQTIYTYIPYKLKRKN